MYDSSKKKDYIAKLHKMFVKSGEYKFNNKSEIIKYLEDALYESEELYNNEHWYREIEDFEEFLNTYQVDSIAYHLAYDRGFIEDGD